jgi:hypothetical protein
MTKKITMTKKAAVSEHKQLVKTLKKGTKKALSKEIKKQSKELKEYKAK